MIGRGLWRGCLALCVVLSGCAAWNQPINAPRLEGRNGPLVTPEEGAFADDTLYVGLAFSGGGHRATAFAYGMLEELRATGRGPDTPHGLTEDVRFVTGVSGGSVMAGWFGYAGPEGLAGFRERYLIEDGEKYMANSALNPITIARGLSGGANARDTFARWLDESLFEGATFGDLRRDSPIQTWINATDVANNTTFLFTPDTFDALCSDLSTLPLSEAVAASAAFPLVFSPIVLEAHQADCAYEEPAWLTTARNNPEATSAMRAHARALESYRDPDRVRFVKLLDGGITDNFGTTGLSVARARSENSYGPLTPEEAVRVNRILFLVSNAATETNFDWTQKVEGPGGGQLATSIIDSSIAAATRTAYDAMRLTLDEWQADLISYRCALPLSEVRRLRGSLQGWDCEDLKLFVGEVSFDVLPRDLQADLNEVPTRLRLQEREVDLVIEAGREATRRNPEFNLFLTSIGAGPQVAGNAREVAPVAVTAITE